MLIGFGGSTESAMAFFAPQGVGFVRRIGGCAWNASVVRMAAGIYVL